MMAQTPLIFSENRKCVMGTDAVYSSVELLGLNDVGISTIYMFGM